MVTHLHGVSCIILTLHDRENIVMTVERTMEEGRNDEELFKLNLSKFEFCFILCDCLDRDSNLGPLAWQLGLLTIRLPLRCLVKGNA
jgi:hypothetical protein